MASVNFRVDRPPTTDIGQNARIILRWFFCGLSLISRAVYLPFPSTLTGTVRASPLARLLRPLLTSAARSGRIISPSVLNSGQTTDPPEVSSTAPSAPNCRITTSALDGYRPLSLANTSRIVCLLSGTCPSAAGDALSVRYDFTSIRLSEGLLLLDCRTCSEHKEKGRGLSTPAFVGLRLR